MRRVITLFALLFIGLYSNAQDSWNAVKVFELDAEDDVYSIYIDSVGSSDGNAVFCFQTDSTNKLIKTDFKGDIIEVTENPYRFFSVLNGDTIISTYEAIINIASGDTIAQKFKFYQNRNIVTSISGVYVFQLSRGLNRVVNCLNWTVLLETMQFYGLCCGGGYVYMLYLERDSKLVMLLCLDEDMTTRKEAIISIEKPNGIAEYRGSLYVYSNKDKAIYRLEPPVETSVSPVIESGTIVVPIHYGLDGKVISPSVPGIHIIKYPDNTVKKSVVLY